MKFRSGMLRSGYLMISTRDVLAALGVFFALALGAPAAQAWGCKGHQTVALIAERHLTPEAKQMVLALLNASPVDPALKRYCGTPLSDPMADASTWPDDIRGDRKNGPWHYIDIPRGTKRTPLQQYCGEQGCVTRAIAEQVAILEDQNAGAAKRAEAVRYVIHFVGDLHQPLHAATNSDEGGNCVPLQYFRRSPREHGHSFTPNLHAIWDTSILERDMEGADPAEYADMLEAEFAADIEGWQGSGVRLEDWAWESHDISEAAVYGPLRPKIAIEPNVRVRSCADDGNIGERMMNEHIAAGQAYQDEAARVIQKRVEQGGVRLAMILNEAAKTAQ